MDHNPENNNDQKIDIDLVRVKEDLERVREAEELVEKEKERLDEDLNQLREDEHHSHDYVIIVNTREKEFCEKEITFREVVVLAYPDANFDGRFTYTVEYSKGPIENPKGSLTDNNKVYVKDKMVFDVERGDVS